MADIVIFTTKLLDIKKITVCREYKSYLGMMWFNSVLKLRIIYISWTFSNQILLVGSRFC